MFADSNLIDGRPKRTKLPGSVTPMTPDGDSGGIERASDNWVVSIAVARGAVAGPISGAVSRIAVAGPGSVSRIAVAGPIPVTVSRVAISGAITIAIGRGVTVTGSIAIAVSRIAVAITAVVWRGERTTD
jgi:hypothetical protein